MALKFVLLLALVAGAMARPQVDVEAILDMPREQAVARLKELLRPSLEAAVAKVDLPTTYGLIDDQIEAKLEDLRTLMLEGNPELGVPVLDPFHLSHLDVETHQSLLDFTGALDDFAIEGLAGFTIDKMKWSTLSFTLTFQLTWPKVEVKGAYDADAVVAGLLPIYGVGPFDFVVQDFVVTGKVKISLKGLGIQIKSADIGLDIGYFHSEIDGMLGGGDLSDLLNEVINDLVPEIWEARKAQLEALISEAVVVIGNKVLASGSYSEVIEHLQNM